MGYMNIALPQDVRDWVENEVRTGGYNSADEYFLRLVRAAQSAKERHEQLGALLVEGVEGLDAGEAQAVTPEWWSEVFADADIQRREAKAA